MALLGLAHGGNPTSPEISRPASSLLDLLLDNCPQSAKNLKKMARSEFGWPEAEYERAMRELWLRFLIVGFGEVDDGAFPSLNVCATQLIFEDLWRDAHKPDFAPWKSLQEKYLPAGSLWLKNYARMSTASHGHKKIVEKRVIRYEDLVQSTCRK